MSQEGWKRLERWAAGIAIVVSLVSAGATFGVIRERVNQNTAAVEDVKENLTNRLDRMQNDISAIRNHLLSEKESSQ